MFPCVKCHQLDCLYKAHSCMLEQHTSHEVKGLSLAFRDRTVLRHKPGSWNISEASEHSAEGPEEHRDFKHWCFGKFASDRLSDHDTQNSTFWEHQYWTLWPKCWTNAECWTVIWRNPGTIPFLQLKLVVAASWCGCFSAAETVKIARVEGRMNLWNCICILEEHLVSQIRVIFEDSPSKRPKTTQECLQDESLNVLE